MKRQPANLSESLRHRLNSYALAASATGVGILALTQAAEAKIVYTPAHTVIPLTKNFPLDLNHDGIVDFTFWNWYLSGCPNLWLSPPGSFTSMNEVWGSGIGNDKVWSAYALPRGSKVGPSPRFAVAIYNGMAAACYGVNGQQYFGHWQNVDGRYLGLKFAIQGKVHYGWARLNIHFVHSGGAIRAVLTGYAYETIPNKPIVTGKTKGRDVVTVEPGSLGALAAGRK